MKVLKWVLIVFGSLVLVLIVFITGVLIWASTVETENLAAADFEIGGTYSAQERDAVFNACKSNWLNKDNDEAACTCIADNAGKESSRYARLVYVATFEGSPTKLAAIWKGLIFSGVPRAHRSEKRLYARQRMRALVRSCRFETR